MEGDPRTSTNSGNTTTSGVSIASEFVQPQRPLTGVTVVHDVDVLCGRGGAALRHPGNQTYRRLVNLNKGLYITCLKTEKLKISRSIVAAIREQQGRFLEKDSSNNTWYDIGDKKAVEKTSQALREGQPKLRQKIVEMGGAGSVAGGVTGGAASSLGILERQYGGIAVGGSGYAHPGDLNGNDPHNNNNNGPPSMLPPATATQHEVAALAAAQMRHQQQQQQQMSQRQQQLHMDNYGSSPRHMQHPHNLQQQQQQQHYHAQHGRHAPQSSSPPARHPQHHLPHSSQPSSPMHHHRRTPSNTSNGGSSPLSDLEPQHLAPPTSNLAPHQHHHSQQEPPQHEVSEEFHSDLLQRLSLHDMVQDSAHGNAGTNPSTSNNNAMGPPDTVIPRATSSRSSIGDEEFAPPPQLHTHSSGVHRELRPSLTLRGSGVANQLGFAAESQMSLMSEFSAYNGSNNNIHNATSSGSSSPQQQQAQHQQQTPQDFNNHHSRGMDARLQHHPHHLSMENPPNSTDGGSTPRTSSVERGNPQQQPHLNHPGANLYDHPGSSPRHSTNMQHPYHPHNSNNSSNPSSTSNSSSTIGMLTDRRQVFARMKYTRPPSTKHMGGTSSHHGGSMRDGMSVHSALGSDGMPDIHMVNMETSQLSLISNMTDHNSSKHNNSGLNGPLTTTTTSSPSAADRKMSKLSNTGAGGGRHPDPASSGAGDEKMDGSSLHSAGMMMDLGSRHSVMSGLSRISDTSIDVSIFSDLSKKMGNVSTRSIAMSEISAIDTNVALSSSSGGGGASNHSSLQPQNLSSMYQNPNGSAPHHTRGGYGGNATGSSGGSGSSSLGGVGGLGDDDEDDDAEDDLLATTTAADLSSGDDNLISGGGFNEALMERVSAADFDDDDD